MSRVLFTYRASTVFFLPDWRVIGEVPGEVAANSGVGTVLRILLLTGIVGSVFGLKLVKAPPRPTQQTPTESDAAERR